MPSIRKARIVRCSLIVLVAALSLPSSGCLAAAVTAGVVGAGAAGYAYYQGAVPRDYPASMDQCWAAAQLAVGDLGMPLLTAERDNNIATIESRTGDGDKGIITLEPRASRVPADGQWTHITVRVALIGDGPVSERVLSSIESRLGLPSQAGKSVPVVTEPTTTTVPVVNAPSGQSPNQVPVYSEPSGQVLRQVPVVNGPATNPASQPLSARSF